MKPNRYLLVILINTIILLISCKNNNDVNFAKSNTTSNKQDVINNTIDIREQERAKALKEKDEQEKTKRLADLNEAKLEREQKEKQNQNEKKFIETISDKRSAISGACADITTQYQFHELGYASTLSYLLNYNNQLGALAEMLKSNFNMNNYLNSDHEHYSPYDDGNTGKAEMVYDEIERNIQSNLNFIELMRQSL